MTDGLRCEPSRSTPRAVIAGWLGLSALAGGLALAGVGAAPVAVWCAGAMLLPALIALQRLTRSPTVILHPDRVEVLGPGRPVTLDSTTLLDIECGALLTRPVAGPLELVTERGQRLTIDGRWPRGTRQRQHLLDWLQACAAVRAALHASGDDPQRPWPHAPGVPRALVEILADVGGTGYLFCGTVRRPGGRTARLVRGALLSSMVGCLVLGVYGLLALPERSGIGPLSLVGAGLVGVWFLISLIPFRGRRHRREWLLLTDEGLAMVGEETGELGWNEVRELTLAGRVGGFDIAIPRTPPPFLHLLTDSAARVRLENIYDAPLIVIHRLCETLRHGAG